MCSRISHWRLTSFLTHLVHANAILWTWLVCIVFMRIGYVLQMILLAELLVMLALLLLAQWRNQLGMVSVKKSIYILFLLLMHKLLHQISDVWLSIVFCWLVWYCWRRPIASIQCRVLEGSECQATTRTNEGCESETYLIRLQRLHRRLALCLWWLLKKEVWACLAESLSYEGQSSLAYVPIQLVMATISRSWRSCSSDS